MNRINARCQNYWETVDFLLRGYRRISDIDVESSKAFLDQILASENPPDTKIALDCGAGMGRVSKDVLIPVFDKVDIVEQETNFNSVKIYTGVTGENHKIGTLYQTSLQNLQPDKRYDLIWCQWVTEDLKDKDLIDFLDRCRFSLNENGVIVVKDNVAPSKDAEYDDEEGDSSVTRTLNLLQELFEKANLKMAKMVVEKDFADYVYPVHSFALIPVM